jgi:hypothetical protein
VYTPTLHRFNRLPEPHHMTHRLCLHCSQLKFALHEATTCSSVGCKTKRVGWTSPLHSDLIDFHQSLENLETSSLRGCHFCSLVLAGFRSVAHRPHDKDDTLSKGVSLFLECRGGGNSEVNEHLVATCGNLSAGFDVTTVPRYRCTDPDFIKNT